MADEQLIQARASKARPAEKFDKNSMNSPVKKDKKEAKTESKPDAKEEVKKEEKKKPIVKNPVVKKEFAVVNGKSLPISLKHAKEIARFIKRKKIDEAIELLNKVIIKKIAVPFRGELAHRKGKRLNGKGMDGGKYPLNASKEFIKLLKTLSASSNINGLDLDKTIIVEIIANKAPDQMHRFGSTKFKRTHVMIKSAEKTRKQNG
ncbi:MAG: uL22 family ribosomal protein [Candidatus Pacearchaeota archaeon]